MRDHFPVIFLVKQIFSFNRHSTYVHSNEDNLYSEHSSKKEDIYFLLDFKLFIFLVEQRSLYKQYDPRTSHEVGCLFYFSISIVVAKSCILDN